jgi:hypothetical protein
MVNLFLLRQLNTVRYYSDVLEGTHCMYGFMNRNSALKCREFLLQYRNRHQRYPCIGQSKGFNFVGGCDTVVLEEERIENMKNKCVLNGVHLIGIHTFEYSMNETEEVRLSGAILTEGAEVPQTVLRDNLEYLLEY